MDVKDLQKLLSAMSEADIGELNLETGDYKLVVKRGIYAADLSKLNVAPPMPLISQPIAPAATSLNLAPASNPTTAASVAEVPNTPAPTPTPEKKETKLNLIEVKAPIVGTFYTAASPDAPAFVKEGDKIQPGKVLCIIEAMKLMNEIEAEVSGTIAEILVRNEEPVEYGQVLFTIDPS
ncbi:MAG: acetyl-CoA carboxylase biotin carboxyl carrier protein [Deinococcales bacterium]